MKVFLILLAILTLVTPRAEGIVKVVSFSSILTEIATEVGGDVVDVVGLVKPGTDPHGYEPTPNDLKQLADARLVLTSGKHLEHYLEKLQSNARAQTIFAKIGDQIPSLRIESHRTEHKQEHLFEEDPHWWHSVTNIEKAVKVVRDALIAIDPANKADFEKNADNYLARLAMLDQWIKQRVAELPRNQRKLVTSHDAFQYFAKQYGFTILTIEGISAEQEASAKEVDELIAAIRKEGVRSIFLEDMLNPKVSSEITRETGAKIGGTLYADGLGLGEGSTYEGMMKHNVNVIVEALK